MGIETKFPGLLQDAEKVSAIGQRSYMRLTYLGLATALLAAVGGALSIDVRAGSQVIDIGGAVAGVAFLAGIFIAVYVLNTRPERAWYEGRAAAESIKTVAWQYSVGGGAFGRDVADPDQRFVTRLKDIDKTVEAAKLNLKAVGSQISNEMRSLRAAPLSQRKDLYLAQRIDDQNRWYADKAEFNQRRARLWFALSIVLQAFGLVLAALKAFDIIDIDLLGVAAAAAASISAWVQTKDHQNLAESYSVTARELTFVRTEADTDLTNPTEVQWCAFVEHAENAVSREHTLWLARRGAQS